MGPNLLQMFTLKIYIDYFLIVHIFLFAMIVFHSFASLCCVLTLIMFL